jgi:hypothetical protein
MNAGENIGSTIGGIFSWILIIFTLLFCIGSYLEGQDNGE